jgi:hypothetical protein
MKRNLLTCLLLSALQFAAKAQTDIDGLMMAKNNFCVGATYSHSSWKNYWEGTSKEKTLILVLFLQTCLP